MSWQNNDSSPNKIDEVLKRRRELNKRRSVEDKPKSSKRIKVFAIPTTALVVTAFWYYIVVFVSENPDLESSRFVRETILENSNTDWQAIHDIFLESEEYIETRTQTNEILKDATASLVGDVWECYDEYYPTFQRVLSASGDKLKLKLLTDDFEPLLKKKYPNFDKIVEKCRKIWVKNFLFVLKSHDISNSEIDALWQVQEEHWIKTGVTAQFFLLSVEFVTDKVKSERDAFTKRLVNFLNENKGVVLSKEKEKTFEILKEEFEKKVYPYSVKWDPDNRKLVQYMKNMQRWIKNFENDKLTTLEYNKNIQFLETLEKKGFNYTP